MLLSEYELALSDSHDGIVELPDNAKIYVKEIEKFVGAKISSISTSPERKDTILIEKPF